LLLPLGLYSAWQLTYWFITEGVLKSQLDADPTLITSLRYLANDKKNAFRNLNIKLLLWLGVAQPDEDLDADSVKIKVIFALIQFIYTLVTILPTYFLFDNYLLTCIYISLMYSCGTWNGASYYIEVFAERYRLQFQAKDDQDDASTDTDDFNAEDEENEDFQNALEDLDQSSDLYKEIVAAIIEDSNQESDDVDAFKELPVSESNTVEEKLSSGESKEDSEEENSSEKVPRLLEEAAVESVGKRSSNASSESNGQWEELDVVPNSSA